MHGGTTLMFKEDAFAPLMLINGSQFLFETPEGDKWSEYYDGYYYNTVANPARDYVEKSEQLVRSTRNANGQVIAEVINRRLNKFDSLRWPYLSRAQVSWLKQQIAKFECVLSYWDSEKEAWINRRYYWGDFEATPCEWEKVRRGTYPDGRPFYYKRPTWYKDVKCNLIDMGY